MSESTSNSPVTKDFANLMDDMIGDLKNTFPEYRPIIERWDVKYPNIEDRNKFLFDHCVQVLPERFFDILYKKNEIFDKNSVVNTEFLPGIVFKQLWDFDISEKTKSTLWDYLQLMIFSIMNSVKDIKDFGDTAKLFEAINEDDLKTKLQETLEGLKNVFENKESMDSSNLPNPEDIHSHIQGMLGGKLGQLAMELAAETAKDLDVDVNDESSTQEALKKLMSDPSNLMNMVNKVGGAIDSKIESGEMNKQDLMKEGMELLNKMQDMPGMENMQDIFNKMGLGKNVKLNTGAMQAKMDQMNKMEKMKERMRKKSEAKKKEKEEELKLMEQLKNAPPAPMLSDEQLEEMFGEEEKVVAKTTSKKKKKNKK